MSIPPGFEAKSINNVSFFTYSNFCSVKIICGTVFIIISNGLKFSPKLLIFNDLCPYASIHAKSSSFLAAHVTFTDNPASFLAKTFPILPNPNIKTSLPCKILFVFSIAT